MPVTHVNWSQTIFTLTNNLINSELVTRISLNFPWFPNYKKGSGEQYRSRAENQPDTGDWSEVAVTYKRVSAKKYKCISPGMPITELVQHSGAFQAKNLLLYLQIWQALIDFFPQSFAYMLRIFHDLPLQKGIPKLSTSFHIKVLLSSELLPSLNLFYTLTTAIRLLKLQ